MDIDDELVSDIKTSEKTLSSKQTGLLKNSKAVSSGPNQNLGQPNQVSGSNQKGVQGFNPSMGSIDHNYGPGGNPPPPPPIPPSEIRSNYPPKQPDGPFSGVQKPPVNSMSGSDVNKKPQSSQASGNIPQAMNPPVINSVFPPNSAMNSSMKMNPNNGSNAKPFEVGKGLPSSNPNNSSQQFQNSNLPVNINQSKPPNSSNIVPIVPNPQTLQQINPQPGQPKPGNMNSEYKPSPQFDPNPNSSWPKAQNFNNPSSSPNPLNFPKNPEPSEPRFPAQSSKIPELPKIDPSISPYGAKAPDSLKMSNLGNSSVFQSPALNKSNNSVVPGRLPNVQETIVLPNQNISGLNLNKPDLSAANVKSEANTKTDGDTQEHNQPKPIEINKESMNRKSVEQGFNQPKKESVKNLPPPLIVDNSHLMKKQISGPFSVQQDLPSNPSIVIPSVINSSNLNANSAVVVNQNPVNEEAKFPGMFPKIGPSYNETSNKFGQVDKQLAPPVIQEFKHHEPKAQSHNVQIIENSKLISQNLPSSNQESKAFKPEFSGIHVRNFVNHSLIDVQISSLAKQPARFSQVIKQSTDVPIRLNKEIPKNPINIKVVKMIPEETYRSQLTLINILSELIDYNQLILKYQDFYEFLNGNSIKGSGECDKIIKFVNHKLYCEICQDQNINSLIELKCKTIVCLNCLSNAAELSIKKSFFECPKCRKIIDEEEQNFIWERLGKSQQLVEREKLEFKLKIEGQLICSKCQKYKKNFFHGCLHVCKECFAADLRRNYVSCQKCYDDIDFDAVLNETFKCKSCELENYFVGSYGKYVQNETHLLCVNCVYSFFNQGFDKVLKIKLSKLERIEINDHLFQRCEGCFSEYFKDYLKSKDCGHMMCQNCIEIKACNSCSSPNNS